LIIPPALSGAKISVEIPEIKATALSTKLELSFSPQSSGTSPPPEKPPSFNTAS
jgi:hypothetical protein